MGHREPTTKQLRTWQDDITKSGRKRITARILLGAFGVQRRGPVATDRVIQWLRNQSPPVHVHGLQYASSLDDPAFLSHTEEKQIGRVVDKESVLMERFVADIMPQLHLQNPRRGFRPSGSRDQLDYLCNDAKGRSVVVEMKKEDGERRVVEQVVRYVQLVRRDGKCRDPRGLILTGYADLQTRHALTELEPQYHVDWFIYGLDGDDRIKVEQVPIQPRRAKT